MIPKISATEQSPLLSLKNLLQADVKILDTIVSEAISNEVALIKEIAMHILKSGGKRIRPLLTLACHRLCLELSNPCSAHLSEAHLSEAHLLAASVELIHTTTLLHDDVVDLSEKRRGEPTAHLVFGNSAAVLVGDYLFSKAFQFMVKCKTPAVLDTLSAASALITEGEVMQLSKSYDIDLSIDDYLEIASRKTAVLFEAATAVGGMSGMALNPQADDYINALKTYGKNLGMAFQVIDDLFDYFPPKDFGKKRGDDFLEGKITLPIIIALQQLKGTDEGLWLRSTLDANKSGAPLKLTQKQTHNNLQKVCELISRPEIYKTILSYVDHFETKAKEALILFPKSIIRDLLQTIPESHTKKLWLRVQAGYDHSPLLAMANPA